MSLEAIMKMVGSGVTALGMVLIVFGAVNLGLTIKDGIQGGGGQLGGAIAMIIGGGVIVAAAVYFSSINFTF